MMTGKTPKTARKVRSRPVTIRDIAKAAGVSTAAVSKALNNKPDVSEELRSRVLTLCEEMDYRPNSSIQDLARQGRGGLTRNIAFVMVKTPFADPAYACAVDGISKAAKEHGLHLFFERLKGNEDRLIDLPPVLRDGRVDGILITGNLNSPTISIIQRLNIPYVILGTYPRHITLGAISVGVDSMQRMGDLLSALVRKGCHSIAYFTENPDNFYEQQNMAAFRNALQENNLPIDEAQIYKGTGAFSGATALLMPVFKQKKLPFDAIVCPDFRTAQEISHLALARAGLGNMPEVLIATGRPFDYYRLPVPAIYFEGSWDVVAHEGVNALMNQLNGKDEVTSKQIVLNSIINTDFS